MSTAAAMAPVPASSGPLDRKPSCKAVNHEDVQGGGAGTGLQEYRSED